MDEKIAIGVDCGTQSIRAMLFNQQGKLIYKVKETFEPYFSTEPGYAEQYPDFYIEKILVCLKRLKDECEESFYQVRAMSLSTLRDTGVFLDQNMEVIRPSMLWLDMRRAKCDWPLKLKDRMAFKMVGMTKSIHMARAQSKVHWLKENEPENYEKLSYYVMFPAYAHYRLTGHLIDSIGNQIGHVPFNYKQQTWPKSDSDYRWDVFGVKKSQLCELIKPGKLIGTLHQEIKDYLKIDFDIEVYSGASDKGCETIGVGCIKPDAASISFGTTATIQTTHDKYCEPILFMPSYPASLPDHFNPEVQVFRGYWMIRWFKKEFAHREMTEAAQRGISPEELLNKRLKDIPPGAEGLMLQPYWTPGLKNPDAKGAIIGFSDVHKRSHIYRAIIEGINYSLIDGLKKIEKKTGVKIKSIMVSGGGSQSDEICQITADMFNLPILRGETYEASGLGAAMNAFVGSGVFSSYDEAVKAMVKHVDRFEPNPVHVNLYHQLYNKVYKRIYSQLSKLYQEINEIL